MSVKVSNSALANNPDYQVEVEDQGGGVLRQVVSVAGLASTDFSSLLLELRILNGSYAQRVDKASTTVTYLGWAEPGTATSAAEWRVKRITESSEGSGDYAMEFADGDSDFDNVWDDRASLSYA